MVWLLSLVALASIVLVRATPIAVKRQLEAITTLSSSQINAFAPFTNFAFAAYCNPSTTRTWTCGGTFIYLSTLEARPEVAENVLPQPIAKRTPTFKQLKLEVMVMTSSFVGERNTTVVISRILLIELLSGYVGFSPSLNTVIVAHQGTDPIKLYDHASKPSLNL